MWKVGQNCLFFSNERHFEIWLPKKKTIAFLWSKLSKLHKKDPILHVTTTFSLKQGETRTNSVPIPNPLTLVLLRYFLYSEGGRVVAIPSQDFLYGTLDTPIFATYPLISKWVPLNFIWRHCDVIKSARPRKFGCIENIRKN